MVYFGKPEDSEGTGSISTIILGGTIVAGGVVLGLVIGAGATMYIFKRLRRWTVENEELQEQYITTESRDPEGGHSYTPYHVQANNTDTDNCESQIYDPVR
ncbi:uncharacterized protein LOC125653595 [Ostrea edulis]|uniref:uncharacterized protein LOC125653595 n=1 Tax=Ostrea edulis TaxID=37623 RepID=UPI0024AF53C9|nr:uncharacterized protein LOC125653595 [Ostrea edulis]